MEELRTMQIDTYRIGFTCDTLQIGCKRFTIEQWKSFTDKEIDAMDSNSLQWWTKWKATILTTIELSYKETT